MVKTILLVALGGGIGSVFRYLSSVFVNRFFPNHFPYATFIVNIIGCFLIGFLIGYAEKNQLTSPQFKYFLITGFCGGLTTFSTFSLENVELMQNNQMLIMFAYIALSVIVGLFSVWLGLLVSK